MKARDKLKYYVMNEAEWHGIEKEFNEYPYCSKEIKPWNIFNNWVFTDEVEKAVKKYKKCYKGEYLKFIRDEYKWVVGQQNDELKNLKTDFDAFVWKIMFELRCEEFSRCEYEILVSPLIVRGDKYEDHLEKIDAFQMAYPNREMICLYILYVYKVGTERPKRRDN